MESRVNLEGAIDLHGHAGPSPFLRRVDGYEFAREAADAGMDGVVLKEHFLPTVYGVPFIRTLLRKEGREMFVGGGSVLNYCNGGFNPFHVQTAINYGATVIWGPTIDSRANAKVTGNVGEHGGFGDNTVGKEYQGKTGLTPLDSDGELKDDVKLCLDKIVDHDIVLGIGHLTFEETRRLVEYTIERGHRRLIIDHPRYPSEFTLEQQKTLASMKCVLNFLYVSVSPTMQKFSIEELYENISAIGVDHCTLSSGTGQLTNPSSPEALRILGEGLVDCGLTPHEFDSLVKSNPKDILDIG